jgi:hypothetical protein
VRRDNGPGAVDAEWRRIWRGYASFAYFAEPQLWAELEAEGAIDGAAFAAPATASPDFDSTDFDSAELVI